MRREFTQIEWNESLAADWRELLRLAIREDLGATGDCTTQALVPPNALGKAAVASRRSGVAAGLALVEATLQAFDDRLQWEATVRDGAVLAPGARLGVVRGPAASILSAERTLLNALGRLCGIASLTERYVNAIKGYNSRIYDTRKTTPGWRQLEKYAVRCGGGWNHRSGLFEAVLIKDNHLAFGVQSADDPSTRYRPAQAVGRARDYLARQSHRSGQPGIVEIEVDTLEQLDEVLPAGPDLVLLDNMDPAMLRQAVARRDAICPSVELEASGGVNLDTVRAIAASGVDRISVGALTHSAACLDIGLDWL